jgi:hypothetical protein
LVLRLMVWERLRVCGSYMTFHFSYKRFSLCENQKATG